MKRLIYQLAMYAAMGISSAAYAQQSIVYSQYIFNGLLINPAYAGSHVQLSSALTYRNQWVNLEGAPQTTTFSIHTALKRNKIGLGLLATSDKIGSYSNTGLFASYSYIIRTPMGGHLSLGLQAGFNSFKADFADVKKKSPDPLFDNYMNELKPNFGGGIYYYNKKMFAGFSVPTILTHAQFFSQNLQQLLQPRFYYLQAGLIRPLDRLEKFKFSPSILIRAQEGTPLNADFNFNFIFYDLISAGLSYRTGDGIVNMLNFKLSDKFYFSYAHDWTTSDIRRYSKGTHEFMINYRVRIRGLHKDVECPYFFHH